MAMAFFVLLCSIGVQAQEGIKIDSIAEATATISTDTLTNIVADSLANSDTTKVSTATNQSKEEELGIKISKDALPAVVTTTAKDSAILNIKEKSFFLYGDAKANYEEIQTKAGVIYYYQNTNVLTGVPIFDTGGKKLSVQEFKQGEQIFTFDTLRYNFKSKRALVRNARSQYGEGFVISRQIKRNPDESIFGYQNLYTTCNQEHPHFGIRAKKIKVIPGKVIASGPANLEIEDVPTPLLVPFGMFPIKEGQRSGFIMPTYTLEERRGIGLQRGGYYFAINDYLGVASVFDIYSKGSWAMSTEANYNKRYQYTGRLNFSYSYSKLGETYEPTSEVRKDFKVNWSHQVDPRSRPGTTFGASVDFGTSTYNLLNGTDVASTLNNNYMSNITYAKSWKNKPYQFTATIGHNQSTLSGLVTVRLPELNFNLGSFSPFQRKVMSGTPRWYEKITFNYSVGLVNRLNFIDTAFSFSTLSFNDFENGMRHTASMQASYTILRYFNLSFSVPYNEYWNTKELYLNYNPITQRTDSLSRTGFFATRDFSATSSLSTRVYGLKTFKKGKIAGLRHVMTPSLSVGYTPSFAEAPFEYMYPTYDASGILSYRSPYANGPYGGPNISQKSGAIGFSLQNTLQMKIRKKDTSGAASTENISLIDGLGINASYNMFADSNNLSNISMNFRTSILKVFNVSASATFDPYKYDGNRRTREYLAGTGGGVADFTNGNVALSMSFRGEKKNKEEQEDAEKKNDEVGRLLRNGGIDDYYDFNIPWDLSINAGINVFRNRNSELGDSMIYRPNLTFSGSFNLTERWKVNLSSGVEFQNINKPGIALTQINISRDLHCWQMNLNLVPFGFLRSFNFTLQVKASVLQDLKLTRRKAYQDNF
mgnify:CR=1 FL=1